MSGNAVDYFIVVGPSNPFKPVTAHSHSAPSSAPARSFIDRTYAAELLFRYPPSDHAHLAFPPGISMFCMTDDLRLSSSHIMPKFYYFVATGSGGERLYGSCLKFYEELEEDRVRQLVAEDERLRSVREKEERERSELRRREVSVSLSKEEEREAELEEEQEREQAQKLMQLHNKIQEDQQRWKQQKEQRDKEKQQQQADGGADAAEEEEEEKEKGHRKQPLTIQLQPSPHSTAASASSPQLISASSSASSPVPRSSSPQAFPDPPSRSRSSPVSAGCSPVASSALSPHLLQPASISGSSAARPRKVYAPKCICTLSLHPFLSQCRSFLSELYRLSLVPSPLPLEHLIANFVNEIPLPPAGELKVEFSISNKLIFFFRPPPNAPLQATHFPLRLLFECLDSDNALQLIEAVLLEQRILLLSTKLSALTVVAETLLHLIFPFRWPHVYIPLLPRSLLDFLFAPMPFIIGMHHSYVRGHLDTELMHDVIVVDLDANTLRHQTAGGSVSPTTSKDLEFARRLQEEEDANLARQLHSSPGDIRAPDRTYNERLIGGDHFPSYTRSVLPASPPPQRFGPPPPDPAPRPVISRAYGVGPAPTVPGQPNLAQWFDGPPTNAESTFVRPLSSGQQRVINSPTMLRQNPLASRTRSPLEELSPLSMGGTLRGYRNGDRTSEGDVCNTPSPVRSDGEMDEEEQLRRAIEESKREYERQLRERR